MSARDNDRHVRPAATGVDIDGGVKLAVELDVTLPQVQDSEQASRIVAAAHQVCPYLNATRGNVDVALTVNGHAVVRLITRAWLRCDSG